MLPKIVLRVVIVLAATTMGGALWAADAPSPAELKLREGLRNTMLQLRQMQTDLATAQAAQADAEQKNKTLTDQSAALSKQLAADKDASDKSINELKTKVDQRDAEATKLNESLEKWKASQKQASDLASIKEAQRAKLASEVIVLQRQVADQQVRNAAMFKLGNEILTRYEKFGLGDALTAREPFIGITRVKFQNLIQDYSDNLVDQRIKPGTATTTVASASEKPAAGKPKEQKP